MSTKTLSEERAAPAGPRYGLSNDAGNTAGSQSPASPRAAGTGLRCQEIKRPHAWPCICDDCCDWADSVQQERVAQHERDLDEQQAEEDLARYEAENGVPPWG